MRHKSFPLKDHHRLLRKWWSNSPLRRGGQWQDVYVCRQEIAAPGPDSCVAFRANVSGSHTVLPKYARRTRNWIFRNDDKQLGLRHGEGVASIRALLKRTCQKNITIATSQHRSMSSLA